MSDLENEVQDLEEAAKKYIPGWVRIKRLVRLWFFGSLIIILSPITIPIITGDAMFRVWHKK